MSSDDVYVRRVREALKVRPVLPFGLPIEIGVIGIVNGNEFDRRGTAASVLGTEAGETITAENKSDWSLTSGHDVQIRFLASGEASSLFPAVAPVDARVELSFGSADSFLLSARGVRITTLKDPVALIGAIIDGYQRRVFKRDYVFVYQEVRCDQVLALLGKTKNTNLLLSAQAKVVSAGLADLAGHFAVSHQSQDVTKLDGGGQVLFYNAYRVKESFWSGETSVSTFETLGIPTEEVFEVA
jgi:hypothetical protein